ncbi:unnamed protein product [Medioppia subpectinata]|uniref:Potassium voltage-gated channel subfamily KQT member 1 n=2 Tax=Medioppia subpectinata TaxID=1979941 RepID=A0A7R9KHM9_9ACAR|nr:unnamed protein product [Medioppia subpectinata]CAG2103474.1 unnamed protein product [Medioppia subpectinata]
MATDSPEYSHFVADIESTERSDGSDKSCKPLHSLANAFTGLVAINRTHIINGGHQKAADPKRTPVSATPHHKPIRWLHTRTRVHRFLQEPNGPVGRGYHITITLLVLMCLLLTILCSFTELPIELNVVLYVVDMLLLVIFAAEYLVRMWASSCVSHYRGLRGKGRFVVNPFRVLDLIVIASSVVIIVINLENGFMSPTLNGVRFFQTFKLIRLEHQFKPWRVMASVIWAQREQVYITTYCSFLALVFTSFLIYFVEKDANPMFSNLGQGLWYTVCTLTTIGYGDIYPITWFGKVLSSVCIIIGVSVFALPAGILGTGLALKVQDQQRQRQRRKRLIPAVKLIQTRWRCHHFHKYPLNPAANPTTTSLSSSKMSVKNVRKKEFNKLEKICMRFVLKVKFLAAKRQFTQSLKPYDVKDVLEQYSSGHTEMLAKVKQIYNRVSGIESMAENGFKCQLESKNVLIYRLSKVEDGLRDTQNTLNQILNIQTENKVLYENILEFLENNASK